MLGRSTKKNIILIALFALFILPFGLAWLIYHSPEAHTLSKKNQGELLAPSYNLASQHWQETQTQMNLDPLPLKGKWGVLLISYPPCHHANLQLNPAIAARWAELNKVKISLGKDQSRLQLIQAFPGLKNPLGQEEGHLYVFDPLGNLILHYQPNQASRAIRQDLKQLLHASQIG